MVCKCNKSSPRVVAYVFVLSTTLASTSCHKLCRVILMPGYFLPLKENVGLKRLSVANNGLGDEGCGAAAVAISSNSSLLELDMSGNRITNTGLLAFASQIKTNETLQVLKVRRGC